jgi:hypothetical protein
MRASFARGWPFVVSGRGFFAVRCVHRYTRILPISFMETGPGPGLSEVALRSDCD